ncbi:surface antigen ariel1, putative [Babesia ovis]|uniref:Surface antigen ariel1, putative n=1 Tax=Babesia ovis TaxID=5869 RepID=A0A9W5WUA9_BABOV|nr:surface antigen ariel1, putative [Babesia ovis]
MNNGGTESLEKDLSRFLNASDGFTAAKSALQGFHDGQKAWQTSVRRLRLANNHKNTTDTDTLMLYALTLKHHAYDGLRRVWPKGNSNGRKVKADAMDDLCSLCLLYEARDAKIRQQIIYALCGLIINFFDIKMSEKHFLLVEALYRFQKNPTLQCELLCALPEEIVNRDIRVSVFTRADSLRSCVMYAPRIFTRLFALMNGTTPDGRSAPATNNVDTTASKLYLPMRALVKWLEMHTLLLQEYGGTNEYDVLDLDYMDSGQLDDIESSGSRDMTPTRSTVRSPKRSKDMSPTGSRDVTPTRSTVRSPKRSKDMSPTGSRDMTPNRSNCIDDTASSESSGTEDTSPTRSSDTYDSESSGKHSGSTREKHIAESTFDLDGIRAKIPREDAVLIRNSLNAFGAIGGVFSIFSWLRKALYTNEVQLCNICCEALAHFYSLTQFNLTAILYATSERYYEYGSHDTRHWSHCAKLSISQLPCIVTDSCRWAMDFFCEIPRFLQTNIAKPENTGPTVEMLHSVMEPLVVIAAEHLPFTILFAEELSTKAVAICMFVKDLANHPDMRCRELCLDFYATLLSVLFTLKKTMSEPWLSTCVMRIVQTMRHIYSGFVCQLIKSARLDLSRHNIDEFAHYRRLIATFIDEAVHVVGVNLLVQILWDQVTTLEHEFDWINAEVCSFIIRTVAHRLTVDLVEGIIDKYLFLVCNPKSLQELYTKFSEDVARYIHESISDCLTLTCGLVAQDPKLLRAAQEVCMLDFQDKPYVYEQHCARAFRALSLSAQYEPCDILSLLRRLALKITYNEYPLTSRLELLAVISDLISRFNTNIKTRLRRDFVSSMSLRLSRMLDAGNIKNISDEITLYITLLCMIDFKPDSVPGMAAQTTEKDAEASNLNHETVVLEKIKRINAFWPQVDICQEFIHIDDFSKEEEVENMARWMFWVLSESNFGSHSQVLALDNILKSKRLCHIERLLTKSMECVEAYICRLLDVTLYGIDNGVPQFDALDADATGDCTPRVKDAAISQWNGCTEMDKPVTSKLCSIPAIGIRTSSTGGDNNGTAECTGVDINATESNVEINAKESTSVDINCSVDYTGVDNGTAESTGDDIVHNGLNTPNTIPQWYSSHLNAAGNINSNIARFRRQSDFYLLDLLTRAVGHGILNRISALRLLSWPKFNHYLTVMALMLPTTDPNLNRETVNLLGAVVHWLNIDFSTNGIDTKGYRMVRHKVQTLLVSRNYLDGGRPMAEVIISAVFKSFLDKPCQVGSYLSPATRIIHTLVGSNIFAPMVDKCLHSCIKEYKSDYNTFRRIGINMMSSVRDVRRLLWMLSTDYDAAETPVASAPVDKKCRVFGL